MNKKYASIKIFILGFVMCFFIFSQAQVNEVAESFGEELAVPENFQEIKNASMKNKRVENQWFDYIDDCRTSVGEEYTYYTGSWQWPDSLPIKPFSGGAEHNSTHGGGMMLDLASDFWLVNGTSREWSRHTRYTLDSIYIPFKYRNFSEKQDSVVINYFDPTVIRNLTWTSNQSPTRSVDYDYTTNSFPDAIQTVTYYLDSSMNSSNFYSTDYSTYVERGIELPVGMDIDPLAGDPEFGNLFAATYQFFGTNTAALGDTMTYNDSTDQDPNNMSLFSLLNMQGNLVTMTDPSMNFGLYMFTSQRYGTGSTWLYPYNPPNSETLFNYTLFKVTGKNVGINEVNNDVAFALSPNPIEKNQILHADFKIEKPSQVKISIFDLQGREISELANGFYVPGEHLIDADLSEMNSGVYMYSIETEHGSASKRFIIQ